MIARWKPVHLGQASVLRALCNCSESAVIGIGSCNRYDVRNPFTADETRDMINLVLAEHSNYEILAVPDLDDGPRWRIMVRDLLSGIECYVTDNPYVASLLEQDYTIVRPVTLVPMEERIPIDGTMVRMRMARGENWQELVPDIVARYLEDNGLDARFRKEFGLETLARVAHRVPS